VHRSITHLSFADWVYFIFDHPAEGPQWYWANDAPFWNGPSALTAEYVSRIPSGDGGEVAGGVGSPARIFSSPKVRYK
jgi:hypothetical protein